MRELGRAMALALPLLGWLSPGGVGAQPSTGAARLGVDFVPLSYTVVTTESEDLEVKSSGTTFGIGNTAGFGLNLGAAVSPWVVFGARLLVQSQTEGDTEVSVDGEMVSSEAGDTSATAISLTSYIEVLFGSGNVRGFVGPMVGFQSGSVKSGMASSSSSGLTLGAAIGAHAFLNEHVSIDPAVAFVYESGSAQVDGNPGGVDVTGLSAVLLLGISGWAGGDDEDDTGSAGTGNRQDEIGDANSARRAERAPPHKSVYWGEDDGTLHTTIPLGSTALTLLGRPTEDPSVVAIRLQLPIAYELAHTACDVLTVTIDGEPHTLSPLELKVTKQRRSRRVAYEQVVQASAPIQLIVDMQAAKKIAMTLCDEPLPPIPAPGRARITAFLGRHRARVAPGTVPEGPEPLPAGTIPDGPAPLLAPPEPAAAE